VLFASRDVDVEGILYTGCDGFLDINQILRHYGRYTVVGRKILYGRRVEELGGFGGISSDYQNVNHGGMGSDSGSWEVMMIVSWEWMRGLCCITSGEVIG
jgi:hypothetical protein